MEGEGIRASLARFGTGVTVVTCDSPDGMHGLTVNSFTSVSLEPALILVSVNQRARGHDLLHNSHFVVNVLAHDQEAIARHFAGHRHTNLDIPEVRGKVAPRLADPLAWFECRPWRTYEGGDHSIYVGNVMDYGHRRGEALGFYGGGFITLTEPEEEERPFPYEDIFELPYDSFEGLS